MTKEETKYPFYIVDIVIFLGINVLGLWFVHYHTITIPRLNWFSLGVAGLAVWRMAYVVSNEKITKPLRAPFTKEVKENGKETEKPLDRGFMGATGSLIYCPSCSGTWISALVVYSYLLWPYPTTIVVALFAISGVERIFALLYGLIKSLEEVLKKRG